MDETKHEERPAMRKTVSKNRAFTLVEIMIVVLIIGLLLMIAVPGFLNARMSSRLQNVIANLRQVDAAKERCAMDNQLSVGDNCPDYTPYIKQYPPKFPVNGVLVENGVGTEPTFKGKTWSQWKADSTGL